MEKERKLPVRPIGLGAVTALGGYLLLLTLVAYLTVSGRVGEAQTVYMVWLCAALASFIGTWTAAAAGGRGAVSMLAGAVFWTVPTMIAAFISDGSSLPRALSLLAAVAVGALIASALTRGKKGRRARRRRTANVRR